jgi:TonB family protein
MNIIKFSAALLLILGAAGASFAQETLPQGCSVGDDKMGRGEIRQCVTRSTNGLSRLVIENRHGTISAYVNLNTTLRNHKTLVIRWDDEKAVTTAMNRSNDFEAMFFGNAQSAISKMAKSKTLMVESDTYRRGISVDTFTISDGDAMANYVLKRSSSQPSPAASSAHAPDKLVQDLQSELNQKGFNAGTVDGYMGQQTQAAIIAAQRSLGLSANGLPSQGLLSAIKAMPAQDARSRDSQRALDQLTERHYHAPSTNATFIVQVITHESSDDARREREKLLASGISSAFVEGPVNVNGIPKYRVRIGPFYSREAAQASQTRLRSLGYSASFITTQMTAPAQTPNTSVVGYGAQVRACLQPGVKFPAPPRGNTNPATQYRVELRPDGTIASVKLTRSSGNPNFDRAVETGIRRCSPFPALPSGKYPSYIDINYNMYD